MTRGTIKKLITEKQIGFIQPDIGNKDVFFHITWLSGTPAKEGQRVEFDLVQGDKGPRARNLKVLESNPPIQSETETDAPRFLNPYNFVRYIHRDLPPNHVLGKCPPPSHDRYVGLTGRITCKVEAITPLFISDSHAVEESNGHKIYRFFQYEGEPALPASSLRGMIRAVFEAVTNSCFIVFQRDEPYTLEHRESRAPDMVPARVLKLDGKGACLELLDCTVNAPINFSGYPTAVRAGAVRGSYPPRVLNQNTNQAFYPDESQLPKDAHDKMRVAALVIRTPVIHRSTRFCSFHAIKIVPASQHQSLIEDGKHTKVFGWLHLTGPNIENKHDERLFFRWDDKQPFAPPIAQIPASYLCECSDTVTKEYNHHLSEYWERLGKRVENLGDQRWPNSTKDMPQPSTFVEKGSMLDIDDLVYIQFDEQGIVRMLRPISMPRIRYTYSRQKFLPKHLNHCKNLETLCPACRVFGWVRESAEGIGIDKPTAYRGRVRLSHGILTHSEGELIETTLAILSTPKPTTTSFYLLNSRGRPDPTVTYDIDDAHLRGRKVYRDHGKANFKEYSINDKIDQNRTVKRALNPGAEFTFTLEFESLAPLELGALLYALELEKGMVHRLGYAKPLGFGSVKVTVEKVESIDWDERLQSVNLNSGWLSIKEAQLKQDFIKEMQEIYKENFKEMLVDLRVLLSTPPNLPVHYPRAAKFPQKDGKNYEWFMGNKKRKEPLPLASNDTHGFLIWDKKGNDVI